MSTPLPPLVSESEALRVCNLPSTPRWRDWLRETLDPIELTSGNVYERSSVRSLARKVTAASTAAHDSPRSEISINH
jgi:hypothetical protein